LQKRQEVAIKLRRRPTSITAGLLRRFLLEKWLRGASRHREHATGVENLPTIHGDPFDRLLIAQAFSEGLVLLTVDKTVARYGGLIRLI
jgi:PIN domain nuclease of toxin-antitoxin system